MSVPSSVEAATVDLSPENEETLRQLVTTIDYAEGLTLLFARCNVPAQRQALASEATRRLAARGIEVVEVDVAEGISGLRHHLRERLAGPGGAGKKRAVFLYGLEHAIPGGEPDVPLLAELNMGRELFHRDAPHPLVFWLPDYALTALARGAPDFWAWRSGVFEFETERAYRQEALHVYAREGGAWLILENLTAEQKRRQEQGDYAEARRRYQQSLEIFERLKSPDAERARRNLDRLERAEDQT